MKVDVIGPSVQSELSELPRQDLDRILFLEKHPEYPTHYLVESFNPLYVHDLKEMIGDRRSIFMFKVDQLRNHAEDFGYERLIYMDDPSDILEKYEHLQDSYPYSLNIELKKFQLQGFNYCKDLHSDIVNWSTGTGKSVYAVAKALYLLESNKVDRVVVVSKGHNKINWQRQFEAVAGLKAEVAEAVGNNATLRRERRLEIYEREPIFIINYEKLRFRPKNNDAFVRSATGDGDELLRALKGQRVYFIWDEMPTKLKNQSTTAWKGARKILKETKNPYQSLLSATPLENSPEDIYACVKLLDPTIFGTLTAFRNQYAKSFNPFVKWQVDLWDIQKLQEMGMRLAHMTHVANKYRDPEIRMQFPKEHWEDVIIDMSSQDRELYQQVATKLAEEFNLDPTENILPKLQILQTICNNPLWLNLSDSDLARAIIAKKPPTDQFAAKIDTLRELLDQIEGKVVLFSMYNAMGSQQLAKYVQKWGHSFVLYDGNEKQLQEAQDTFQNDPSIKVFISSDRGSDSINLEQATSVINFDLPWKYSTLLQRVNRINRITSEAAHVWYFNLITAGSMEERKKIILDQKKAMHEAIENPSAEHAEAISTLTIDDYLFILTGQ